MKCLTDKHLYWLAWLFAVLAAYFLVSAFYISSQGIDNDVVTIKEYNFQTLKVNKKNILQGEEYLKKSTGS